ncbi:hypothetical protein [Rhizorhabdus wittichii]|nr:hypothetical protein [Rhizorhabdus wittichii]
MTVASVTDQSAAYQNSIPQLDQIVVLDRELIFGTNKHQKG